jgi:hypothetical protein
MCVEAFDKLMLDYVLRKLTDLFEEIVLVSKDPSSPVTSGIMGLGQSSRRLPVWLSRLRRSDPYLVTDILIDQMHVARKQNRDLRFEAQNALLNALVEDGVALHIASYSVAVVEKRLKCFLNNSPHT